MSNTYNDFLGYDATITDYYAQNTAVFTLIQELLGDAKGTCLDIGCGTGVLGPLLKKHGLHVTGVDTSEKQLAIAKQHHRLNAQVLADVGALPFADNSYDVVVSCYTHTDFADWEKAVQEAARVLKVGGIFVYVGPHPCFFGPHAATQKDDTTVLHPGYYGRRQLLFDAPGFSPGGVRQTVGARHLSFSTFLNAIITTGFSLQVLREPELSDPPITFGVRAVKIEQKLTSIGNF